MSHSLIGASRTTHLKIVCVALMSAITIVVVGITARVTDGASTRVVVKATKPAVYTAHDSTTIR
jgi:hypothetical protein